MKRYSLMIWMAMAVCIASCNKHDDPPKKLWQLQQMDRVSGKARFDYDAQRSLTHITKVPWSFGPNFLVSNDAWGRPLIVRDSISTSYDSLVYQSGKLVRVDARNGSGAVTEQIFFTYDNKGRLIRKDGRANYYDYAIYTYEGNSRNVKRASYYSYVTAAKTTKVDADSPSVYIDFTYDSKINPFSTFLRTDVIPFWMPEYWGNSFYDPITPNNPVTQEYFGKVNPGYFKFQRFDFSYTYEYNYPVTLTSIRTAYNQDGMPSGTSTYNGGYTYFKFN